MGTLGEGREIIRRGEGNGAIRRGEVNGDIRRGEGNGDIRRGRGMETLGGGRGKDRTIHVNCFSPLHRSFRYARKQLWLRCEMTWR